MSDKVWFITGASKGFGRYWAEAALKRGDKVAVSARSGQALEELVAPYGDNGLAIPLDVTDRDAAFAAVAQTNERFGSLDVVVNNAGYGHFGTTEELTEDEARRQIDVNLFGPLWVIQAALPIMRAQGSGHLLATSSIGGIISIPTLPIYHASKWAIEGLHDTLAQEVAGFGIKVTLIEPGGYATDWGGASAVRSAPVEAYDPLRNALMQSYSEADQGDPAATADAILAVVDAEEPPLRIALGRTALGMFRHAYQTRLDTWSAWEEVTTAAHG